MKHQSNNTVPVEKTTSYHLSPTTRLSDNAFYLIVLASLLKKAVEPGQLKQLLVPGAFIPLGNNVNLATE